MKNSSGLFKKFGMELEYMVVDSDSLDIRTMADVFFHHYAGNYDGEYTRGRCQWSNELALHVMEVKNAKPISTLNRLDSDFQDSVRFANAFLQKTGLRLMPSGMHPWMNPAKESKLWPHDNSIIYDTFNRIFGCKGHGWTNLQSSHLNLPFSTEDDFRRLHTAIRLILPIIPALSAASPICDGKVTGNMDHRLNVYKDNCIRIPSVTGGVIPAPVESTDEYKETILNKIYRDLEKLDPEGVLKYEWANARGAIARFQRNTIEIRVIDNQECPTADVSIGRLIVQVLKQLCSEQISTIEQQLSVATHTLRQQLAKTIKDGDQALISGKKYLEALGIANKSRIHAKDVWSELLQQTSKRTEDWHRPVIFILDKGCLARRMVGKTGPNPSKRKLKSVYLELSDCLQNGKQFE